MSGRRRAPAEAIALLVGALLHAAPAAAQELVYHADLFGTVRERWRGVQRNIFPLLQADGMLGARTGVASLSGGAWGAVEPGDTRNEPRPDLRAGRPGFSTSTAWVQVAAAARDFRGAAGLTRDWFRRVGRDAAVTELYLRAQYQRGRWAPALSVWQAVSGAEGTYLEPALAYHHFVNPLDGPAVSWTSTVHGGFQVARRSPERGAKVPGPEGTGFTHAAVGTGVRAGIPLRGSLALLVATGPELQVGRDAAVRRRRDGSRGSAITFWWPVRLGVTYPMRRAR